MPLSAGPTEHATNFAERHPLTPLAKFYATAIGRACSLSAQNLQAIAALNKALLASPGNAEVLLSLGVSYTNELDQRRAISYLMEWLKLQPHQRGAASVQLPSDSREKLRVVSDIFLNAAQMVSKSPSET